MANVYSSSCGSTVTTLLGTGLLFVVPGVIVTIIPIP